MLEEQDDCVHVIHFVFGVRMRLETGTRISVFKGALQLLTNRYG